jgi:hypothetical protein
MLLLCLTRLAIGLVLRELLQVMILCDASGYVEGLDPLSTV